MKYKVAIYSDKLYADDILWGFTAAGCEAQIITPASIQEFDRLMGEINPDLLILSSYMGYFKDTMLKYIGFRKLQKYKCVAWDTEGVGQFDLQMKGFELSKPDMIFSICPEMLEILKSKNIPCERLDFAYNPTIHYHKSISINNNKTISLVGNAWLWYSEHYPEHFRYSKAIPVLLKPLIENSYKIDFYGTTEYQQVIKNFLNLDVPIEWFKGTISYEKTCDIYNNSFINLITQNHEQTITRRTFEILGSGGFGLSCYNSALKDMFGNSKALAITKSPNETLDLIEHYRRNVDDYIKVRKNAAISVQNHTYKERAETIIDKIFKKDNKSE
ncbi:MAG: LysM peptidoglycan-binding protein [Bacillota bacterium]|jgi:spore maturation protein CgeB|nr:LysM peptidoglycan-binding protein [Bacillota bacterium]